MYTTELKGETEIPWITNYVKKVNKLNVKWLKKFEMQRENTKK